MITTWDDTSTKKMAVLATMHDIAQKLADSCKKNNPKSNLDLEDFYDGWSNTCGRGGNSLFSTHIMYSKLYQCI